VKTARQAFIPAAPIQRRLNTELVGIESFFRRTIQVSTCRRLAKAAYPKQRPLPLWAACHDHWMDITMKIKNTLLALAFTSAGMLVASSAFAQSAPTHNDGWFVNGNVGRTSINHGSYNDSATGCALSGGYRWELRPAIALGAEVE
jgi:hypothetical protein